MPDAIPPVRPHLAAALDRRLLRSLASGVSISRFGHYHWMWIADMVFALLAALDNLPIRGARVLQPVGVLMVFNHVQNCPAKTAALRNPSRLAQQQNYEEL